MVSAIAVMDMALAIARMASLNTIVPARAAGGRKWIATDAAAAAKFECYRQLLPTGGAGQFTVVSSARKIRDATSRIREVVVQHP
jgi:hypothetical protein